MQSSMDGIYAVGPINPSGKATRYVTESVGALIGLFNMGYLGMQASVFSFSFWANTITRLTLRSVLLDQFTVNIERC